MNEVTLAQVLQNREERVRMQKRLLQTFHSSVICFTMNIAGPVKTTALIERGFYLGMELLEARLPSRAILHREVRVAVTGCEAFYAVEMEPESLKEICVTLEENSPLGRLLDLDVLAADGRKLERQGQRGCLICGAPGRGCAARRLHTVSQLQNRTQEMLCTAFAEADSRRIACIAADSLREEVSATPKPGLVDRRNCGSHRDMNIDTFFASAQALEPYFENCVRIGQETADAGEEETFSRLRQAGIAAEEAMYRATGGVNTHKGAIYSMGILCGSLGRLWNPEKQPISLSGLLEQCARLAGPAAGADFCAMDGSTAGQRLYLEKGITGIRGEAANGFPSVSRIGLPAFLSGLKQGLDREKAGILALLHLILQVQDTTLLHRGGEEGATWAAKTVKALLSWQPVPDRAVLEALDDAFVERNLSAGGCADLLAVIFFLTELEKEGLLTLGDFVTEPEGLS